MTKMPYLQIGESKLFYQFHEKKGVPLVFIHGWAGDLSKWDPQVKFFSNQYPVIVYDLMGHGNSDTVEDCSIRHHSIVLHDFLQQLGVEQIYLIGHSMGGMVAQQFIIDFPEYVQKLVLISTCSKIITSLRKRLAVLFMRVFLRISFKRFFRQLLLYTQSPDRSPEELTMMINRASSTSHYIIRKSFAEMTSFKSSQQISQFKRPTLILVGKNDPIISELMARDLKNLLPNSRLEIFKNGYHELMVEAAEEINRAILKFIVSE